MKNHYKKRKSPIMHYAFSKDEKIGEKEQQITEELENEGYFSPRRKSESYVCMEFSQSFLDKLEGSA